MTTLAFASVPPSVIFPFIVIVGAEIYPLPLLITSIDVTPFPLPNFATALAPVPPPPEIIIWGALEYPCPAFATFISLTTNPTLSDQFLLG